MPSGKIENHTYQVCRHAQHPRPEKGSKSLQAASMTRLFWCTHLNMLPAPPSRCTPILVLTLGAHAYLDLLTAPLLRCTPILVMHYSSGTLNATDWLSSGTLDSGGSDTRSGDEKRMLVRESLV